MSRLFLSFPQQSLRSPLIQALRCALLLAAGAPAWAAAPPPAAAFFQDAEHSGASMSPDGSQVAMLVNAKGLRSGIMLVDLASMTPRLLARYPNADVSAAWWLNDQRLAFTVANITSGAAYKSGLYAIGTAGGDAVGLDVTVPARRSFTGAGCGHCGPAADKDIIMFGALQSEHVMAKLIDEDRAPGVAMINARTGNHKRIPVPKNSFLWVFDADERARVALAHDGSDHALLYREADGDWRTLQTFAPQSPAALVPDFFVNNALYVRSNKGGDRKAVYRYDLAKGAMASEPIISSPDFDINPTWVTNGKKLLGLRVEADQQQTIWFDAETKKLQETVDQALPNTVNTITRGIRSSTPFVLVHAFSAVQPALYYVYNTEARKLTRLGGSHPLIEAGAMADKQFVRYPARDGLSIPAYVTVPAGSSGKHLPTIVLVGDSAWARNGDMRWDPVVQFLASRGYAVIEPDARGAIGFGNAHHQAGVKQWGTGMQNDLADGAAWAIKQGIADPKRICIAGASYGGYAAMMGVLNDPALFRCALSWSGITDPATLFKPRWDSGEGAEKNRSLSALIGDPVKEVRQLHAVSPLHQAARIKAPVLLAYGKEDVYVHASDGAALAEAIRAGGNQQVQFHLYDQKGQAPISANRTDLWTRIEAFLARYNGPP